MWRSALTADKSSLHQDCRHDRRMFLATTCVSSADPSHARLLTATTADECGIPHVVHAETTKELVSKGGATMLGLKFRQRDGNKSESGMMRLSRLDLKRRTRSEGSRRRDERPNESGRHRKRLAEFANAKNSALEMKPQHASKRRGFRCNLKASGNWLGELQVGPARPWSR